MRQHSAVFIRGVPPWSPGNMLTNHLEDRGIIPGTFPVAATVTKQPRQRNRLTDRRLLPHAPVCSLRLPKRTNALSAGTWDECSTCAHSWQDIAVFAQELSPTDRAMFWHQLLLQFSLLLFIEITKKLSGIADCFTSSVSSLAFVGNEQTNHNYQRLFPLSLKLSMKRCKTDKLVQMSNCWTAWLTHG